MARNLSPALRQELANLDKGPDSRKSAMKALKSYVKDLDSKAIPLFLAQVSETKETGALSGEYTISLYEVLARVHGVNIVPQIDSIMATVIKTLASSAGSFPLQQACSKVVPAIARYGIEPTTPEDKKRHVIHSLCKPLSEALLGSQESLTSGAALCLKALVDSDNWRFASDEMVNRVCQNVAVALEEKSTQTNSHMALVMALAKHNPLIVEAYARLLIQSGLRILNAGVVESNSQKRLSSIQMVNFLMKCLDARSIFSEVGLIIEEMEKCQSDQMAYVSGAAFEAMHTAKKIAAQKGSNFDRSPVSVTGSNSSRRDYKEWRSPYGSNDQSPTCMSPESRTLDSFAGYDSMVESPVCTTPPSYRMGRDCRSVNRKLWNYENGGVDISLKDGLLPVLDTGSSICNACSDHFGRHGHTENGDNAKEFLGFMPPRSPRNGSLRSATPSPQRSRSHLNVDNVNIFTTPRKLIRSLQDSNDLDSDLSDKPDRKLRSPCSVKFACSPNTNSNENGFHYDGNCDIKENGNLVNGNNQSLVDSESVSSTDDVPEDNEVQIPPNIASASNTDSQKPVIGKKGRRNRSSIVIALLLSLLVIFLSVSLFDDHDARTKEADLLI